MSEIKLKAYIIENSDKYYSIILKNTACKQMIIDSQQQKLNHHC